MRGKTLFISVALHALAVGFLIWLSRPGADRRSTAFAVVTPEKKKPEAKPEPPKPPPPAPKPPKKEPVAEVPAAAPAPTPAPEPTPAPRPAAVSTGLTLGNDGPGGAGGVAVAGLTHGPSTPGDSTKAAPKREHEAVKPPPPPPDEDNCTEAPSKPVPLVKTMEIEYPAAARANGVEGRLVLTVTVASDGTVLKVEVANSVEESLDAAAMAAVRTWRFKPAFACGKPVNGGVFTVARRFELGD
jgi:protein TonB